MPNFINHLRHRPSLMTGLGVAVLVAVLAGTRLRPVTSALIGWDVGIVAYGAVFLAIMWRTTPESLKRMADLLDEGRWGILGATIVAAVASLGAIVFELAHAHGKAHGGFLEGLGGVTVLLSWFFIHTIFATHYAHEFWQRGGLIFPGNDRPNYSEFLYFSFCIAVASQVSDVSTQTASMRKLVLAHSMVAYLFNTAVIALGVNIAASLAG